VGRLTAEIRGLSHELIKARSSKPEDLSPEPPSMSFHKTMPRQGSKSKLIKAADRELKETSGFANKLKLENEQLRLKNDELRKENTRLAKKAQGLEKAGEENSHLKQLVLQKDKDIKSLSASLEEIKRKFTSLKEL
jgi:predicted RNase H-like nuclease (RuvC/YqgF family)